METNDRIQILNKTVLEEYDQYGKTECLKFIIENHKNISVRPVEKTYSKTLEKLLHTRSSLLKSKHKPNGEEKFDSFLHETFVFPSASVNKRIKKLTSDINSNIESSYRETISKLKDKEVECESLNESLKRSVSKLKNTEESLTKSKLNLKRTSSRVEYVRKKLFKYESSEGEKDENNNKTRTEIILNEKDKLIEEKDKLILEKENLLKEKDRFIEELKSSCEYLESVLHDIDNESRTIDVFDCKTKTYNSNIKQCIYELLEYNVSAGKVSNVIECVLKLVNIKANKLPCKSTVLNMNLQRLCLAQKQISECFSQEKNTTLLTDETSKFGTKYMGYEAADEKGNLWVLGLREIETKSAEDTLKVFKQILSDINDVCHESTRTVSHDILVHIVATLSDRAATEVKFNELLYTYRKDILPLIYTNYESFDDVEKQSLETMCNFFCGLHALVNFADTAQTSIKEVEKVLFDGNSPIYDRDFFKDSEPGTCRLVRTASKAFGSGPGGDEKSGCQGPFKVFVQEILKDNKLHHMPLKPYRGSRFNILFENALCLLFT